ncbi:type I-E CRISPR-associated protein Cas7/Cse4/CasC [Knoellia koreensis]|uniref:Type I-E CRISPR-associated protein Cas7/Cse4/CasC n=1 Tax=Knoellia koreensis TaxID=2730921 RepID=A0A849HGW3_9MICO|nr:type I-E CRISPR-associated protein Cas7/Cse4/CasC [Knoellia sp. DB2414S]NNM46439.1 type I-E CRISPR-associated protein Cas7/Cse4/CasC [Knoellia sp. DB2414S]
MSNTYVCVHVLQDVPPANLNRDDNGTPKQAVYGGVDRLRVSSQAWKRATRMHFRERMDRDAQGIRTRRLHGILTKALEDRGKDHEAAKALAKESLGTLKITPDRNNEAQSSYLLFAGRRQLEELADALAADGADAKSVDAAEILGSTHPLDVALFGRMVADMTQLNVDAAAQVAHAISTHAAPTQFDYFTAVDDQQEKDEAGAGMIGTVEFNSGTLYRYAVVGVEQLVENMGDREEAIAGIGQFIESFVQSMPTGKQNTFAAHTRPALVLVEVRDDQPVSLVSAFESPVRPRFEDGHSTGYMGASLERLARHHRSEAERWGDEPRLLVASYAASGNGDSALTEAFGESTSLPDLVTRVTESVSAGGRDG